MLISLVRRRKEEVLKEEVLREEVLREEVLREESRVYFSLFLLHLLVC